ncbi:hypothetical protein HHK36_021048 [Tetracentron sinense]|uniref:L-dopachrome isomerase n=1 Tax=Tetracentron sinense TaxID=13715 RepID=A0A834YW83_TETSI|nr:hypothetical protein HHK36_021048 [Tetracentron sinense]
MTRLAREGLLSPLAKVDLPICEPCLAGKACRKPFGKAKRVTQPLELVHSDICRPMSVKARHGASYFLTFIDDYTRYGYVQLIAYCHEALDCFKRFVTEVENQQEKSLKTFRTDRGRDTSHEHEKLDPRTRKNIFIRYSESSKDYVMYGEHPNGGMIEVESRNIDFIETDFPSISVANKDLDLYELEEDEVILPSSNDGGELVPRPVIAEGSGNSLQPSGSDPQVQDQARKVSSRGHIPCRHFEIKGNVLLCATKDEDESASFNEALSSSATPMPTLNLFTNVPVDAVVASDILRDATKAVAKIIGKPESVCTKSSNPFFPLIGLLLYMRSFVGLLCSKIVALLFLYSYIWVMMVQYVMILINGGVPIAFAGTEEPAAYGELISIGGLGPSVNGKLSSTIAEILETKLSVDSARFYIKFYDVQVSY